VTAVTPDEILALLREQRQRFPGDADALDRVGALFGLPALDAAPQSPAPELSLPVRIQAAKASALGWSTELFALTVLIGNAAVSDEGELLHRGRGPVVAVCAEYGRPLVALEPPAVAGITLDRARTDGVPTLRLPGGFLRPSLRVEPTAQGARTAASRAFSLARATRFLDDLSEAWKRRMTPALEVAWPVYRADRLSGASGPPLDAVSGLPMPELELR